jgi:hypothetical protein
VIYLNGTEVARRSMPAGTITWTTRAIGHESGLFYEQIDLAAFTGLVVNGENVLAVEVHQVDAGSSDLVMDLALTVGVTGGGGDTPVFQPYGGNPVVTPSGSLEDHYWRGDFVGSPEVVRLGPSQWVMFFTGNDGVGPHYQIGRGVSSDGIHWTLDDAPVGGGHVTAAIHDGTRFLHYSTSVFDDEDGVGVSMSADGTDWFGGRMAIEYGPSATVIRDGTRFKMWSWGNGGLAYSTSPDGLDWANHGFATGIASADGLHVIKEDGVYKMWFRGEGGIRYATSADGLTWTPHGISLPSGNRPCVIRDGTTLRMWYGDGENINTAISP